MTVALAAIAVVLMIESQLDGLGLSSVIFSSSLIRFEFLFLILSFVVLPLIKVRSSSIVVVLADNVVVLIN